jgi:Bacterial extracellular solute-binding protein
LARQLEGRLIQADVFVPITPGPVDIVKKAGMIGPAVPVASTQMVIAYSPKSKFVPEFEAAAQAKKPWYDVLQTTGLRFGRTDPATDPQGQNIIFTMLLAQNFYKLPGLADKILGGYQNPQQIFTEPSLLSRLEAGQIDEHLDEEYGPRVFQHACKLGLEGIVSKRRDSPYSSGRSRHGVKSKNPNAPAAKRETEEDWGQWKA